jgi:hypothetical protein
MASSFTWLDYSEHERRKMLDVIDLFKERDTRDELGIGSVRDAFADMLFPGTSTIQSRARYFLFIPWMYLDLERLRVPANQVATRARQKEVQLINALADSDDPEGTIGIQARESLQRLPSNIYWQGLGVWGIRLFPGSQEQYHRRLDWFYERTGQKQQRNDDGEAVEGRVPRNWHPGIPPAPEGFPTSAAFKLTREEAEYLHDRIMMRASRTLLAFLVDSGQQAEPVSFPWEHPLFAEFPAPIREQLEHGRNFSEAVHGAALLYNLMLAEQVKNDERIDDYRARLQEWAEVLEQRSNAFARWDRGRFWEIVKGTGTITQPTRLFIDTWLNMALLPSTAKTIADCEQARRLIREREQLLKRGLARLNNPRAQELWNGEAGTAQLNYRWRVSQVIVLDILKGLAGE